MEIDIATTTTTIISPKDVIDGYPLNSETTLMERKKTGPENWLGAGTPFYPVFASWVGGRMACDNDHKERKDCALVREEHRR